MLLSKNANALSLSQKTVISRDGKIETVLVITTDLVTDSEHPDYDDEKFSKLSIDAIEHLLSYPNKIDRVEIRTFNDER